MHLKEIELKNFRNYEEESFQFHKKVNIIRGNNGQGKTNLLESIYLMSMGKSFRTTKDFEMVGFEHDFLRVKGIFEKDGEDLSIEIIDKRDEKRIKINGIIKKKNADLLENAYIVAFIPEDLRIVKGEPEKRRKFIDRELFILKPLYYKTISKYKKLLHQRNTFLKDEKINRDMLDVWDDSLADCGAKIIEERSNFIDKLKVISKEIYGDITGGKENIDVTYESDVTINKENQKKQMENELREAREKDIARRQTTRGPHKDDIKITMNGTDIRYYGSQGQQRTAALSLKLAELELIKMETGEDAIILLDDVLSELDKERQRYLINSFKESQIFITAAEISDEMLDSLPEGINIYIENGKGTKIV